MSIRDILKSGVDNIRKKTDYTDIPKIRRGMEFATSLSPTFHEKVQFKNFVVGDINCKWVLPKRVNKEQVILHFHGGGYASGSIQTHKSLLTQLTKHAGTRGLLFEYRLSPEYKFPLAIEDAVSIYQWLLSEHYLPENIVFCGDSAGGGLAVATMLYLRDNKLAPLPNCCVLMSPWLDLTCSGASMKTNAASDVMLDEEAVHHWADNYIGNADKRNPYASPVFADLHGLPPIYIQVCDIEILLDDSVVFAQRAKEAGVDVRIDIYKNLLHVWQAFWALLADGRKANLAIGEYIKQQLKSGVSRL